MHLSKGTSCPELSPECSPSAVLRMAALVAGMALPAGCQQLRRRGLELASMADSLCGACRARIAGCAALAAAVSCRVVGPAGQGLLGRGLPRGQLRWCLTPKPLAACTVHLIELVQLCSVWNMS